MLSLLVAGPCSICNQQDSYVCIDCSTELKQLKYYCAPCSLHQHQIYCDHEHDLSNHANGTLQLLSVLCIETSHYVCFTRITGSGKDEWVFFDSMAERQGNMYVHINIPQHNSIAIGFANWNYVIPIRIM